MTVVQPPVEVVAPPVVVLEARPGLVATVDFCSESEDEERSRRLVQSADQQICFASQTESLEVSDVGVLVAPTTVSVFCLYFFLFLFFLFFFYLI